MSWRDRIFDWMENSEYFDRLEEWEETEDTVLFYLFDGTVVEVDKHLAMIQYGAED